jgi:hypothetical protein
VDGVPLRRCLRAADRDPLAGRDARSGEHRRHDPRSALGRRRTDVALAYAPDGSLLIAYPVYRQMRAAIVSRSGAVGRPFKLGPASEVSRVVAEIGAGGRAVVAWTTIDAGEERNERRRVYAVTREPGASTFGRVQLVDRARHLNIGSDTATPIRLAVAAHGRALLMWASDHSSRLAAGYAVRVAQATPRGRFAASRQLVAIGSPGDVAIRDDGTALAVFLDSEDQLRAVVHNPERRSVPPSPSRAPMASSR